MSKKAQIIIGILGVIIAAIGLIPSFGDWLFPLEPSPRVFPATKEPQENSTDQKVENSPSLIPTEQTITIETTSQMRSQIVERGGVPPYETLPFNFALNAGEIIVGQSYGFQEGTGGCYAFLVMGPGQFLFTITDGVWLHYKNISSDDEAELLLDRQKNDLVNAPNSQCSRDKIRVSKLP